MQNPLRAWFWRVFEIEGHADPRRVFSPESAQTYYHQEDEGQLEDCEKNESGVSCRYRKLVRCAQLALAGSSPWRSAYREKLSRAWADSWKGQKHVNL